MSASPKIIEVETAADAELMANFFKTIWTDGDEVVPFDMVLAVVHIGGYAALAKLDGQVVGASFGFLGEYESNQVLHSHVTAASLAGVGFQLKQHQFSWAQERSIGGITWTFDPLVRRNCIFNFEKLGARAVEYLPNFYGTMKDSINAGDDSDRLFTFWPVQKSELREISKTDAVALRNISGVPEFESFDPARAFWIELPEDIENLRKSDIELARVWRKSVRNVLEPALDKGWHIASVNAARTAILVEPGILDVEPSEE